MVVRCQHIRKGNHGVVLRTFATRTTARCGPHRAAAGTKVGYRAGTGFALYRVEAAYLDEALRLDAQEVKPADDAGVGRDC